MKLQAQGTNFGAMLRKAARQIHAILVEEMIQIKE
jgi:hypothetical protein